MTKTCKNCGDPLVLGLERYYPCERCEIEKKNARHGGAWQPRPSRPSRPYIFDNLEMAGTEPVLVYTYLHVDTPQTTKVKIPYRDIKRWKAHHVALGVPNSVHVSDVLVAKGTVVYLDENMDPVL